MDWTPAIGRVLMVAPPPGWAEGPQDWLDDLQPAGIILFKRNLPEDFEGARRAVARLHAWGDRRGAPLIIAADEEGGFVTQTSSWFPTPPAARCIAWAGEPEAARRAFALYGARLRDFGIDLDFAPVCDVNNNPRNPVIGSRSFGAETGIVTRYARAVHDGLQSAGVLSCAKHFPGHGDTDVDSHLALPVVPHDRARLERLELVPFRALLAEVPVVMVAHVACPQVGDGSLPATLSPRMATDLLRHDLGFTGTAITDAMDMQGVAGQFGDEEAAVRALVAGCDLLLYCFEIDKPLRARAGLRAALESGRVTPERLAQAGARVEKLQAAVAQARAMPRGALQGHEVDAALYRDLARRALQVLDPAGWRGFALRIHAASAVTVTGAPDDAVARLAARFVARGIAARTVALVDAAAAPPGPVLVVLAERRPLDAERIALLRQLALAAGPVGLANVLTPENDAPLVEAYTMILRSADHSDATLDVVAERILDAQAGT